MSDLPDELGLKLFAAWCGTTSEHAATRTLWEIQGAQYTVDGWNRVSRAAREFHSDQIDAVVALNSDLLAALKYARRFLNWEDHDVEFVDAAIKAAEKQSAGEQS